MPLHAQVVGSTTEPWSPTLPPSRAIQRTPLATLPPLPAPNGLPQLQSEVSCPGLQQRLAALIGSEAPVWSVSVADPSGRLLADVNGTRARVPASNQKLLSTAFALDRLGPDFRLNTRLWRLSDGTLRLTGQGDPDLALPHLQRFAKLALASSGGVPGTAVKLQLAEEPAQGWWPQGWSYGDRSYAYGAPITRLAITSNAIEDAVSNPPSRLATLLQRAMTQQGAKAQLSLVPADAPLPRDAVLVHEEPSINMHGLLSLANTESHNFTAEVLLRSAAGTWDVEDAARLETVWLKGQGLPMQGVIIHDGSGLSRNDRLTSRLLAALLLRMDQHPYGRDYIGSMSIAGQRGTMRHLFNGTSLDGRLFGKTGTLTGVRAISGVLQTSDGPRYVSAISNGASMPNQTIGQIMRQVQNVSLCP
ncbi:MAG: D-alanyl-D-alanine carboxypeptidase/D-alanyl-D-alanine-endopeptidase [Cyanobacteria bacterium]|nr:D-alanyl-D-alanine carboxypeptidase/D-alanyl-D-alanine-endopeptidase [Cyanobacteriota bacterium]